MPKADAVLFHLPSIGRIEVLPKRCGHIWILWSMESVENYPLLTDPSFVARFDLVMTYERGADIWDPYVPQRERWEAALAQPIPAKTENAVAVMLQSSYINRSGRIDYAVRLMRHLRIDSLGQVLNNRALPDDRWRSTKLDVIGGYKFCISMEIRFARLT